MANADPDGHAREYETAVGDVMAHVMGPNADVGRRVRLRGQKSKSKREFDVVIRGHIPGIADSLVVVDCKCWKRRITSEYAGSFAKSCEDVGADIGILVTSAGMSKPAARLISRSPGLRIDYMPVEELKRWRPPGTRSVCYAVAEHDVEKAQVAFRKGGFRTRVEQGHACGPGEVVVSAFRHFPLHESPDLHGPTADMLQKAGVVGRSVSGGVVIQGGTPQTTRLEITLDGVPANLWVFAADEASLAKQLEMLRHDFAPATVDVVRPAGWPPPQRAFGAGPD